MRTIVRAHRSHILARCAVVALFGGLAAGCSSDFSRLAQSPAPRAVAQNSAPTDYTGAIPAPVGRVQASALTPVAPPLAQSAAPMASAPNDPYAGGGLSGWSAEGGSRITVTQGETVETLASRYGVPSAAIRQANNLSGQVQPGQAITIPVYRYADGGRSVAPTTSDRPVQASSASGGAHVVTSGETLYSVARRYGVKPGTIASANGMDLNTHIKIGQRLVIPGGSGTMTAASQPAPTMAKPAATPAPAQVASAAPQTPPAVDEAVPFETTGPAAAEAKPETATVQQAAYVPPASNPTRADEEAKAGPLPDPGERAASNFRWPVRGRVISNFGDKPNGQRNDGINLSVPEGTPVKAAENGVVVYAGNELKGFGNLILVRHADEYVTAYAHNSALDVKRGDTVRRGQIIAKAGKTGNVGAPQVHFEIRKGSTPVDPMKHLSGA